jgi:hypothetical protein
MGWMRLMSSFQPWRNRPLSPPILLTSRFTLPSPKFCISPALLSTSRSVERDAEMEGTLRLDGKTDFGSYLQSKILHISISQCFRFDFFQCSFLGLNEKWSWNPRPGESLTPVYIGELRGCNVKVEELVELIRREPHFQSSSLSSAISVIEPHARGRIRVGLFIIRFSVSTRSSTGARQGLTPFCATFLRCPKNSHHTRVSSTHYD